MEDYFNELLKHSFTIDKMNGNIPFEKMGFVKDLSMISLDESDRVYSKVFEEDTYHKLSSSLNAYMKLALEVKGISLEIVSIHLIEGKPSLIAVFKPNSIDKVKFLEYHNKNLLNNFKDYYNGRLFGMVYNYIARKINLCLVKGGNILFTDYYKWFGITVRNKKLTIKEMDKLRLAYQILNDFDYYEKDFDNFKLDIETMAISSMLQYEDYLEVCKEFKL